MKKNNSRQAVKRTVLAVSLMAIFSGAKAEPQSEEVRALVTPESSASVSVGEWSKDRRQQGQYDGMAQGKAYGAIDIDINQRDSATGTWVTVRGGGIGLKSSELEAEWLRQGDIGVSFEYSRLQKSNPLLFNVTNRTGIGTTSQLTSAGQGPGDIDLKLTRDAYGLGFKKRFSRQLELHVSLKTEDKRGNRNWGARQTTVQFLAEPINSQTNQFEATLNYASERLQLSGGYYGSQYRNANQWVEFHTGGQYVSLPYDNQAHQLYLNGGYELAPKTRLTFKLALGRATQDEAHPAVLGAAAGVHAGGLDGQLDTTLAEVALNSRLSSQLSLLASLRHHELDDKTPVRVYAISGTTSFYNTPYSFESRAGKLEATYRFAGGYSVTGGLDYREQDRSVPTLNVVGASNTNYVPYRAELNEQTYRVDLRKLMSETFNGSIGYHYSDRDGSASYRGDIAESGRNRINPLHIADRIRHKVRALADWSPTEQFSAQILLEASRDDYGGPALPPNTGLQDGQAGFASIDLSYAFSDNLTSHAWYSRHEAKAKQSILDSGAPTTTAGLTRMRENGDNLGLGLKGRLADQWIFGADLDWSRSVTEYDQSGRTGAPLVPEIKNRSTRLSTYVDYEMNKKQTIRFMGIHEKWRSDDWTWTLVDGGPVIYGAGDLTRVASPSRESSDLLGLRFTQKF